MTGRSHIRVDYGHRGPADFIEIVHRAAGDETFADSALGAADDQNHNNPPMLRKTNKWGNLDLAEPEKSIRSRLDIGVGITKAPVGPKGPPALSRRGLLGQA